MNVGFIGLGKLGLPCALAMEQVGGHKVVGYDVNPSIRTYIQEGTLPYKEEGALDLLKNTNIKVMDDITQVVQESDLIFCAVQTPHAPEFEGITPFQGKSKDFDYSYLETAVREVSMAAEFLQKSVTLVVISTVLPGTMRKHIKPLVNSTYVSLCYNPYFIAMGTTIKDFLYPEFTLLGCDDDPAIAERVKEFYGTVHDSPVFITNIETAEAIKVGYNTFIGLKIVFANTWMELASKLDINVDHFYDALAMAHDRIISPKYMRGGMGDGGGCHPRDNYALAWLADEEDLSYNLFHSLMMARDLQTKWLADEARFWHLESGLPIVVLGKAYKPETNLTVGSPAILLYNFICQVYRYSTSIVDPYVDGDAVFDEVVNRPAVYVIGTNHQKFASTKFAKGSIVLDPWRYIPDQEGVTVYRLGSREYNV